MRLNKAVNLAAGNVFTKSTETEVIFEWGAFALDER